MTRRSVVTGLAGAAIGAMLAFVAVALSAGIVIDGAILFVLVDAGTGSGRAVIEASAGALYTYVLLAGGVGGAVIAYLAFVAARLSDPKAHRFGSVFIGVVGAATGAVTAYGTLRSGIGLGGSIEDGLVALSAFRGLIVFVVSGSVAGASTGVVAEWLSRPGVLGLQGEAWPASGKAFLRETMPAMLIPTLAIIVIASVVYGISRVLLVGNNVVAVAVASVLAALVLGGGVFLANAPPKPVAGDEGEEAS